MLQGYKLDRYEIQSEKLKHYLCDNADRIGELNNKYCTKLILYFIGSRIIKENQNFGISYIETFKQTEINFFYYYNNNELKIYFFEENQGNLCRFLISKNKIIFEVSNVTGQDNTIDCKRGLLNDLMELFKCNNFLEGFFDKSNDNWNIEANELKNNLDEIFIKIWDPDDLLRKIEEK